MTRKHAIAYARIAGYHDDSASFTRLIIECRVNRQTMNEAWMAGQQARLNGVKCSCYACNQKPVSTP